MISYIIPYDKLYTGTLLLAIHYLMISYIISYD